MPPDSPHSFEAIPPDALISACIAGECVLFAGAGLSKRAGFPTWADFVSGLLDWATTNKFVDDEWARTRRSSINKGDAGAVADGIIDALQDNRSVLHSYLETVFTSRVRLSNVHTKLRNLTFCAALTTNFDKLLEQTFEKLNPPVYTPNDAEQLIEALHKRDFFVLKLYGDLSRSETLMISPTQFEDAIAENLPFSQFMETLFLSKTLLFLGASLEGIEDYLKGVGLKRQRTPRDHWALVGVNDEYSWLAKAESFKKRYGIEIIPYRINEKHTPVFDFVTRLEKRVRTNLSSQAATESVTQLNKVQLENIGPFQSLELKLDPNWNILLGDNGVGKSNILKAIALAICGKDAQSYASRLIKAETTGATITLETDRNTYKTRLLRTTSGPAQIETIPVRPLEAEGWLAIGFPALRTVSWERPTAPGEIAKSFPTPEDLLPLVKGDPDPRLDKLKQWIVNLDYLSKHELATSGTESRYEKLLNKFFECVSVLTGDITLERGEVNPHTYEVSVITDDGALPIEAVSQGMISLIGWVGILLQRLYEIYSDDEDPTQRFALVMMDEIDAHLHPTWQQSLVSSLSKVFPNVQFIATTHSPLIVGGLPPEQIVRLNRDENGKVVQLLVEQDMTVGRADQILTGELFNLKSTLALDEETHQNLNDYKVLLGKSKRTEAEERRFQDLRRQLHSNMPMSGETRAEREVQAQERETVRRDMQAAFSVDPYHSLAQQFAWLLVSEIEVYNDHKVKSGLASSNLYPELKEEIDKSREMYFTRVTKTGVTYDYFYDALVDGLAKGDEEKLGSGYFESLLAPELLATPKGGKSFK